ncbi:hypothetical protein ACFO6R_14025 [Eubacterium multiforme]|uniref:RNase P subunit RPR2 n=1 Tax=Eubacterium multiforme TaxID=83339 RepID=A0ABT9UXQ6_9FIRM|nr:hypothetical protein [Eubacterium multiforme]MDQ0151076.1 RNase P subunit RPR2 [Eubacterium multiforme]
MNDNVKTVKENEKEEIKETKQFFSTSKDDVNTEKLDKLDELNKMKKDIKATKDANESSSIARAEKKLDLDTIKDIKHEVKLEAKEKIRFLKDCERILIKAEKEEGKSSTEIIKDFNEMFDAGMKQFAKDNELSRSDEENLVKDFKKNFE